MGGLLPFSYGEIEAYCRLKGIYSIGDRERLIRMLDVLDKAWMKQYIEKETNSAPNSVAPKVPPSQSPPRGGGYRSPPRQQV